MSLSVKIVVNMLNAVKDTNSRILYDGQFCRRKSLVFIESHTNGVSRIDTQDLILGDHPNVQRFIEIGPSKVLSTMAGKTLNRKFLSQDRSRVVKRQLLSDSADTKAVYYEYDENDAMEEETPEPNSTHSTDQRKPDESKPTQVAVSSPAEPASLQSSAPSAHITSEKTSKPVEDVPLSATDIVLALVAQKFKQPTDELPFDKSIRDLSGGESSISYCS